MLNNDLEKFLWNGFLVDQNQNQLINFISIYSPKLLGEKFKKLKTEVSTKDLEKIIKKISSAPRETLFNCLFEAKSLFYQNNDNYNNFCFDFYDVNGKFATTRHVDWSVICNNTSIVVDKTIYDFDFLDKKLFPRFKENQTFSSKAILSELAIKKSDIKNKLIVFPIWKNSKDTISCRWLVPSDVLGRFYNAFMNDKIIINPKVNQNGTIEFDKLMSVCDLEKIGF